MVVDWKALVKHPDGSPERSETALGKRQTLADPHVVLCVFVVSSLVPTLFLLVSCRLPNLDETCYMNAVLQALLTLRTFVEEVHSQRVVWMSHSKSALFWYITSSL